jgi:hypothetical protein
LTSCVRETISLMRTNVSFRHPAKFVPLPDTEDILAVGGAQWFADLLRRIPEIEIDRELCQEDWGVVVFARRNQKLFWIGLSAWYDDQSWLAHFHHGSFAWLQRFSASGKTEMKRLLADVHAVLSGEPAVSDIVWYEEKETRKARPSGFATPLGDQRTER